MAADNHGGQSAEPAELAELAAMRPALAAAVALAKRRVRLLHWAITIAAVLIAGLIIAAVIAGLAITSNRGLIARIAADEQHNRAAIICQDDYNARIARSEIARGHATSVFLTRNEQLWIGIRSALDRHAGLAALDRDLTAYITSVHQFRAVTPPRLPPAACR